MPMAAPSAALAGDTMPASDPTKGEEKAEKESARARSAEVAALPARSKMSSASAKEVLSSKRVPS